MTPPLYLWAWCTFELRWAGWVLSRWSGTAFLPYPTIGGFSDARHVQLGAVGTDYYLAVAQNDGSAGFAGRTFLWNTGTKLFTLHEQYPLDGGQGAAFFNIQRQGIDLTPKSYLMFAGVSVINADLYRFNTNVQQFDRVSSIKGTHTSVFSTTLNGTDWLTVCNIGASIATSCSVFNLSF